MAEAPDASRRRPEPELIAAARNGDELAFGSLVDPLRPALHAHCYRMLGSLHDADDALQETWLRAFRAIQRFEERSAFKSWLYRIATNVCLDEIADRARRELPTYRSAPANPSEPLSDLPLAESVWVEPYAERHGLLPEGFGGPDACYELRESIELAFVATVQHLPPHQRAALLLREVLGFSAREAAEMLETTTASVNSALQRARTTVEQRLPEQSQQQTRRSLGERRTRDLVQAYLDAWDRRDIEGVITLLTQNARFSMPPLPYWFQGHQALRAWLPNGPLAAPWRWRHLCVEANAAPAIALYCWHETERAYIPFALNLLTLDSQQAADGRIREVTAFIVRAADSPDPRTYERWPEQPVVERKFEAFFGCFGLPKSLT